MNDLEAVFDAHVAAEFQDLDLEATLATMTDDPCVHHVPTITGAAGPPGAGFLRHWDQATVLVQAGLLDSSALPDVGSQQAEALLEAAGRGV